MKFNWTKIANETFGEDKVSTATLTTLADVGEKGGEVEVGIISKYRYDRNAVWEFVCFECDERFYSDHNDVTMTSAKQARAAFEHHYHECTRCKGANNRAATGHADT